MACHWLIYEVKNTVNLLKENNTTTGIGIPEKSNLTPDVTDLTEILTET